MAINWKSMTAFKRMQGVGTIVKRRENGSLRAPGGYDSEIYMPYVLDHLKIREMMGEFLPHSQYRYLVSVSLYLRYESQCTYGVGRDHRHVGLPVITGHCWSLVCGMARQSFYVTNCKKIWMKFRS